MRRLVTPILLLALGLTGCGKKVNVLAKIDGAPVTQPEFDGYLKSKHISAADAARRDRAFEEYLERAALASVIEKEKLLDQQDVDAEVDEFRRELLISRYFDRFLDDKVTDGAIKNYYDAHAATYEQRKVHVAHILVRVNQKASPQEKQAKRTTADGIAAKLGGGDSFEELAKTLSDDHISGVKGGDLGWIREGSIDPELSKRAFTMKAGSVSEPFETPFGFHILKVLEEAKTIRKPYATVASDIRYQLRGEAKEAELKRLQAKARVSKANAYVFDPASVPSAKPARSGIVPTLPGAESELPPGSPSPLTQTEPGSPANAPALTVPTVLSAAPAAAVVPKPTTAPSAEKAAKPAGKPTKAKPGAAAPTAPAPAAPAPPAPAPEAPAEAPPAP
ncbi:MAG TPA: peptidylprolyl isomerase [Polyangiaceae bacterium]|nr:peptidylprolyl isomerase [Polyangiaceae bacterium]